MLKAWSPGNPGPWRATSTQPHRSTTKAERRPSSPARAASRPASEHGPDTPAEEREPNFARGISEDPPEGGRAGRFSEGEEELPHDAGDKNVERRFSEGIEQSPTSD